MPIPHVLQAFLTIHRTTRESIREQLIAKNGRDWKQKNDRIAERCGLLS